MPDSREAPAEAILQSTVRQLEELNFIMETTEIIRETRHLTRPRDGRWLGGVSAGLGAYFDLSPTIYRIAFVALTLAGGTGILLYAAAWLVIPEEGSEDSVAAVALKRNRERPSRLVGLALIGFVGIVVLSSTHFWPGPGNLWLAVALAVAALGWWQLSEHGGAPRRTGGGLFAITVGVLLASIGGIALLDLGNVWNVDWRVVLAAMAMITGALVAVGAATGRKVGAVVVLDIVLVLALALALFVHVPLFTGVGDRVVQPSSLTALDRTYEHGIGDFNVDLTNLPVPVGETHVKATLGIGDLRVHVPYGVKVVADGRASAGQVHLFGHMVDGATAHESATVGSASRRVLVLDARVGLGRVQVTRG